MSRTIETEVFKFAELSDRAKEKARDWYRSCISTDEWWEGIYSDAEQVHIEITGFDLDHGTISGRFTIEPHLVADEIVNNHGESCDTYRSAEAFLKERDEIVDTAPRDEDGEFEDERELDNKLDEVEAEFLKSILEDYRIMLQRELEFQMSNEQVDEAIEANEYEFTADGEII